MTAHGQVPPQLKLEEDIEFSNVTRFRRFLLGAVKQLCDNPGKRYVITKHGHPEAVLMSFRTYSLLKRVMDEELARTATQNSSEAISAAFARLRAERQDAPGELSETRAAYEDDEGHDDARRKARELRERAEKLIEHS